MGGQLQEDLAQYLLRASALWRLEKLRGILWTKRALNSIAMGLRILGDIGCSHLPCHRWLDAAGLLHRAFSCMRRFLRGASCTWRVLRRRNLSLDLLLLFSSMLARRGQRAKPLSNLK